MMNFIFVVMGGALGTAARYGLGCWISGKWIHNFPLHTFLVNITGAFLLGLFNALFMDKLTLSPEMRLAMTAGFLGAFTTFSAFGYETIMLIKDGHIGTAGIYTLASIVVGFLGVFLGMELVRLF